MLYSYTYCLCMYEYECVFCLLKWCCAFFGQLRACMIRQETRKSLFHVWLHFPGKSTYYIFRSVARISVRGGGVHPVPPGDAPVHIILLSCLLLSRKIFKFSIDISVFSCYYLESFTQNFTSSSNMSIIRLDTYRAYVQ